MSSFGSAQKPVTDQPPSRVNEPTLYGIVWGLCGLAIIFVTFRIVIRIRYFQRLSSDDYFCISALLILIGNSVVIQLMSPPMYAILSVSNGLSKPGPEFMADSTFYLKCQFASTILFWSVLWAVKGCFLAFFRRLTNQTKWPRVAWWFVTTITALSYIGSLITYPVACTSFVLGQCQTPLHAKRSLISLRYSTAVDIITDLMIMALPLWLVFGLQMSLSQKLGLCGVLGLGAIIIVFSVIRIIVTNTNGKQPEVSWLALWSSIESSIAVIVACLASFKVLLNARRGTGSYKTSGYNGAKYYANGSRGDRREQNSGVNNNSGKNNPKNSAIRLAHRELTSGSAWEDAEMENLGSRYGNGGVNITGGKKKGWNDDSESQEHIMDGDDIRVQTTWNVEVEHDPNSRRLRGKQ